MEIAYVKKNPDKFGIEINGVTIYLATFPDRKKHYIMLECEGVGVAAPIAGKQLVNAIRFFGRMIGK